MIIYLVFRRLYNKLSIISNDYAFWRNNIIYLKQFIQRYKIENLKQIIFETIVFCNYRQFFKNHQQIMLHIN